MSRSASSKLPDPSLSPIDRLIEIMARLRDPNGGCPWDVEQDYDTIAPYTIEEAYEVAEAIRERDFASLKDELGDLLFQVVYHAQMASEDGHFAFDDVAGAIADKMIRRHPHVFGDGSVADADAQTGAWERHKAGERATKARVDGRRPGALDGVTVGLPALTRAVKLQKRAARVGFDWPDTAQVLDKVREETDELATALVQARDGAGAASESDAVAEEFGDLLFVYANLARHLDVDPEAALRAANAKFERRFRRIEALLAEAGRTPDEASLSEMDALWDQAKAEEREGVKGPAAGWSD